MDYFQQSLFASTELYYVTQYITCNLKTIKIQDTKTIADNIIYI